MILAQSSGGGSPILIVMIGFAVVMFIMMRNQKRKVQQQQELQRAAEIGDEVMTTGGIFGTIVDEDEEAGTVIVEIAPGTRITMLRQGIARRITEDEYEYEGEDEDDAPLEDREDEAPTADADGAQDPTRP